MVFFPSHIIELTNFSTRVELYSGSATTSLGSGRRLRGMRSPYFFPLVGAAAAAPPFGRFAPYLERLCLRFATPAVSSVPRTT